MDKNPNTVANNSESSTSTNSVPVTSPTVKRRRSNHHRRRNNAKRISSHEKEKQIRRKLDLKIFMFTAPSLMLVIGGILWFVSNVNPDESMRPKGLIRLSHYMLITGGIFFGLVLLVDWIRKILKYEKDKRDKTTAPSVPTRRRSTHRRHRHDQEV